MYTTVLPIGHLAHLFCLAGYDGISGAVPKDKPQPVAAYSRPCMSVGEWGAVRLILHFWVNKADQPWQGLNQQLHPPWRRVCSFPGASEVVQVWVCFSASAQGQLVH